MLVNGPRLLLIPKRSWPGIVGNKSRSALWLIAASLTAAVWPGIAVVAGHLGSTLSSGEENAIATMRAAVGLMSVTGSAVVMAPAFTLALLWLVEASRGDTDPSRAGPVAMGIIWPAWASGMVLALPPFLGQVPEIGEFAWTVLATLAAFRALRIGAEQSLSIRRRWRRYFMVRAVALFVFLFVPLTIVPAIGARAILGASSSVVEVGPPKIHSLPRPPKPYW